MFLRPRKPETSHAGSVAGVSHFGHLNSSVVSFASSSNDDYGFEESLGSRGTSTYHSHSGSSRGHQHSYDASPHSTQLPLAAALDESSDIDYHNKSTFSRRRGSASKTMSISHDSSFTKDGTVSSKSSSSGIGTLRGLGRRLFNRSTTNLKPTSLLASRSHSASSDSTAAHSPPLTPTTPPLIQPISLPNGHKDFFSTLSSLPSSIPMPGQQTLDLRIASDSTIGISPKTKQGAFDAPRRTQEDIRHDTFATSPRAEGGFNASPHQRSIFLSPSVPDHTVASPASSSTPSGREISAVIEEESESDFLRAVLNFGEGQDPSLPTPSFRGGRAAPLPTRSSSLGKIAGFAASPSSFRSPSSSRPPIHRTPDGRLVLTEEAARDFAKEKPTPSYIVVQRKYRRGLFGKGNDSESEDEYGDDEDKGDDDLTVADVTPVAAQRSNEPEQPSRFRSSFAKAAAARSPSREDVATQSRPAGLDSAAKKALYNCTLLKVHMHLATTLAGDADARAQIPAIAAGEALYSNEDLRFPRSINPESKLRQHSSTFGFARNLHVALARTQVMRKLRRERLPIAEEVEISWFQRRYGSTSIPTDHIAKALQKRQMISPEALAKPPVSAPQDSAISSIDGPASNRRLSGIVGMEPGQKSDKNGIIAWAQRPAFLERTLVSLPADDFAPGEILLSGATKLGSHPGERRSASPWSTLSFSPRVRVLAGLPSKEEEMRTRYPHIANRSRSRDAQSKRNLRLATASDGAVWEGPDGRTLSPSVGSPTHASPSNKAKRLPPWLAPRSPQLLSPQLPDQLRSARSASEGLAAFSTLHQNSSTSSIPEVNEGNGRDGDSSDEEVPLAQLHTFRAQRTAEKEQVQKLENEIAFLKQRELARLREEEERKAREEEARRLEAQRVHQERVAATQARKLEENRRVLQEARERRGFTKQSVLLAEPNYGAGNKLLGFNRPKPGGSPSSPNLGSTSTRNLYAQPEEQRRSRTSVVQGQPPLPMASAYDHAPGSLLVDSHRASMASLATPSTLPHRQSMAAIPTSPQIAPRRTSLRPPHLNHATSMQHLAPSSPGMGHTPAMLSTSPTAAYLHSPLQQQYADPRLSMSMTNLQAQAYMHMQAQHQAAQMSTATLQRPVLAQTVQGGARRPRMPPLVSLYGDVVPGSAHLQR